MQFLQSKQTSAKEKEKSGFVIKALVLEMCCDLDRCSLMDQLLVVAESSSPGIGEQYIK